MELACGKSCLFQILPFFAIPTTLKARKSYLPSRLRDCLLPIFPLSQTPPLTIPQSQWQKALFYIETTLIWYIKQYRKYCTALWQLPLHKGAKLWYFCFLYLYNILNFVFYYVEALELRYGAFVALFKYAFIAREGVHCYYVWGVEYRVELACS